MKTTEQSRFSATVSLGVDAQQIPLDFPDGDVLLVDASPPRARALADKLGAASTFAGGDVLAQALARPPQVVLLALEPSGEPPAFLRELRAHSVLRHIPVLALADRHELAVTARLRQLDVQGVVSTTERPDQLAAHVATLRLAAAISRAGTRERNRCQQTLLDSMQDGFCIVKLLFDAAGRALDYRFLLVNAAFERQTGLHAAQGRLMRELAPAHEEHWFELYGQVAQTGEPLHFERAAEQLGRWYEVDAVRYGRAEDHEVAIFFRDISARKQAEEENRKNSAALQMAMRLGRVGAWRLDVASGRVEWSREARAIHELPDGFDISLESATELVDAGSRACVEAAVQTCASTGEPFELEARARTCTGRPLWIRLIGEAARDPDGTITSVQGAVQDITDLTSASRKARELGDQLDETMESMTDAFVTLGCEDRFVYVNGRAERLLRCSRSELLGKRIWETFPHLVGTSLQHALEQAKAHFATVETEIYSDRLACWLAVRLCPSERGLAMYIRDISHDKSTERALADREEHYRLLFESALDGILELREDGSVIQANEAACRLFGMSEAQLRSLRKSDLVAPEDRRLHALTLQRMRTGSARGVLTAVRADGSRFEAEIVSTAYRASNGESGSYALVRDISDIVRSQHEADDVATQLARRVQRRTLELEAANRELKEFAQALAHDVRGPIAAIGAFASVLARDLSRGDTRKAPDHVARIQQSVARVNEYTEALLSMARLSHVPLKLQEVDLSALAHEIVAGLRMRDPQRLVTVSVQDKLTARGDPALLRMLMENLLSNAWKFTGRKEQAAIGFSARVQANGTTLYQVCDNGAGFDMAHKGRLFGSFQRLHAEREFTGTGVGLANVHRIVTRHGGRVWAEAEPGAGARFFFTLEVRDERSLL